MHLSNKKIDKCEEKATDKFDILECIFLNNNV